MGDCVVVRSLIFSLCLTIVSQGGNFSIKQIPTHGFSLAPENEINAYVLRIFQFFLYFYCCRRLQHIRSYSTTIFSGIVKIYHYGSYIGQDHLSKLKGLFGDVDLGQSKWIIHHILCNSIVYRNSKTLHYRQILTYNYTAHKNARKIGSGLQPSYKIIGRGVLDSITYVYWHKFFPKVFEVPSAIQDLNLLLLL